jgi:hypothetical protein
VSADPQSGHSSKVANRLAHSTFAGGGDSCDEESSGDIFSFFTVARVKVVMGDLT